MLYQLAITRMSVLSGPGVYLTYYHPCPQHYVLVPRKCHLLMNEKSKWKAGERGKDLKYVHICENFQLTSSII